MIDINGPKIRTGALKNGQPVSLVAGQSFRFMNDPTVIGDETQVAVSYTGRIVHPGDEIFVDDGLIGFRVKAVHNDAEDSECAIVECTVENSATLGEFKGINLPGRDTARLPVMSIKDKQDIVFAIREGVEFIALSCVRSAEDVMEVRSLIWQLSCKTYFENRKCRRICSL